MVALGFTGILNALFLEANAVCVIVCLGGLLQLLEWTGVHKLFGALKSLRGSFVSQSCASKNAVVQRGDVLQRLSCWSFEVAR